MEKILMDAIMHSRIDEINTILESGFDISDENSPVLPAACLIGNYDVVYLLINFGANIDAQCGMPLKNSVCCGHLNIAELLLDCGADINKQDIISELFDNEESNKILIIFLFKHSAKCKLDGGDDFIKLCKYGDVQKINKILKNQSGEIPIYMLSDGLIQAAIYGHAEIARKVIKFGADVNISGCHPLRCSRYYLHKEIEKILLNAGALSVIPEM